MSSPDFHYPVIGLRADRDVETFRVEKNWPDGDVGIGADVGATLVDSEGRAWTVGERQMDWSEVSPLSRVVGRLFGQKPPIERLYFEQAPLAWAEVIEHVCATVDAYPENWMSEHFVGPDGAVDLSAQGVIMKSWVRQASRLDQLVQLLWWTDWDDRQAVVDGWSAKPHA